MSDKTSTIALVVFWSILLLSISFLLGVRSGKHSADRWWQAHQDPKSEVQRAFELIPSLSDCSIECLVAQGHQPYIVSARKCTDPQPMDCFQPKPAPAGIGKPQAPAPEVLNKFHLTWLGQDAPLTISAKDRLDVLLRIPSDRMVPWTGLTIWNESEWKQCGDICANWDYAAGAPAATHPLNGTMKGGDCKSTERGAVCGNSAAAHPLKRPKTWPPDCKLPSCAPVSTEPLHWADGTCTDFFTQETIPCPLKLGKPPCCSAIFETIPERLCESPKGCTSLPKDMAFFSILESDDVYDGKSDKFYARCSVKNHVSAYCESIKPPEGEAVDFRTGKLGKRKPEPHNQSYLDNHWNFCSSRNDDPKCPVTYLDGVPTPQVQK